LKIFAKWNGLAHDADCNSPIKLKAKNHTPLRLTLSQDLNIEYYFSTKPYAFLMTSLIKLSFHITNKPLELKSHSCLGSRDG